ncbi:MAG: RpiB/LacA/LacB family sugar-phosphate isomerase [Myxococcota bacterium]
MKVAIASDHAGYAFKDELKSELERLGHEVEDFGTDSAESCDYPDFGIPAAQSTGRGETERTILACTNGIGMSMLANRIPGVRAALVYSERSSAMTRNHHDSNVLCLGAGEFPSADLLKWVRIWLEQPFEAGRHARRIAKVEALDDRD